MQAPDGPTSDELYLQRQVKLRTDGRVRIVLDNLDYTSRYPDNEAKLVRDLRNGKVSFAWLPARAWERASPIHVFRALQAPFLVDSYPLLDRIATGPIGQSMLRSLSSVGIAGLGLVPNELRRPLGRFPLDSLAAFRGARIRVVTSPTSVRDLNAIGAIPLTRFSAQGTTVALAHGKLDGVESELRSILNNYYVQPAPYLPTNLTMFAKLQTVVIRADALAGLSPADGAALRAAVVATARHADPGDEEKDEEKQLCQQGLRLVTATAADLAALRRAEAPVYARLERDAATRSAIEAIEALKRKLPADASLLGPCPRQKAAAARSPAGAARFPQGTFETTVTAADFNARQQVHNIPLPSRSVYVFHDGRFREYTRPVSQPPGGGRYVVAGNVVTLITETPASSRGVHDVLRWSYYRGELTFRVVSVFDSESRIIYSAHPYRRVSG
jgi:TRAP-type C4-dicarboxylate transport system substrate-binding protein